MRPSAIAGKESYGGMDARTVAFGAGLIEGSEERARGCGGWILKVEEAGGAEGDTSEDGAATGGARVKTLLEERGGWGREKYCPRGGNWGDGGCARGGCREQEQRISWLLVVAWANEWERRG